MKKTRLYFSYASARSFVSQDFLGVHLFTPRSRNTKNIFGL